MPGRIWRRWERSVELRAKPVSFYVQGDSHWGKAGGKGRRRSERNLFTTLMGASVILGESSQPSPSPITAQAADEPDEDLVNRGIEKGKEGDLDGAIADFTRAIELNPKDDAPYYNRAQAKRLKKDATGAIADYTRAIELGSTNPAAYNNRGNVRSENNDPDGASADYSRAIELKPDYARAYYNRAVTKKAKGDKAGAEADFKMARKLELGTGQRRVGRGF